jgi:hypothetical protein
MPGTGAKIGIVFGALLFAYWEFISHVDLSPGALDTHLWIFWSLLVLGVLGWLAVAGARLR